MLAFIHSKDIIWGYILLVYIMCALAKNSLFYLNISSDMMYDNPALINYKRTHSSKDKWSPKILPPDLVPIEVLDCYHLLLIVCMECNFEWLGTWLACLGKRKISQTYFKGSLISWDKTASLLKQSFGNITNCFSSCVITSYCDLMRFYQPLDLKFRKLVWYPFIALVNSTYNGECRHINVFLHYVMLTGWCCNHLFHKPFFKSMFISMDSIYKHLRSLIMMVDTLNLIAFHFFNFTKP